MHVAANEHVGRSSTARIISLLRLAVILLLLMAGLAWAADRLSPWPAALVTRAVFTRGARTAYHLLEKHLPGTIYEQRDQHYDASEGDAYLDVYSSASFNSTPRPAPTVVWIHGGAMISGNKNDIANYARILASRGVTVVAVDYSLAPASLYPAPLQQLNTALNYLLANADRLHVDPSHIFLAGDSAGAQLAAQLANIISSPPYAAAMGIHPAIQRDQLKGAILFCGIYDIDHQHLRGITGFFMRNALRSYFGMRDFRKTSLFDQASVLNYVTAEFPPAFLSVGNADPLEPQSRAMAQALSGQGVLTDTLFFPADRHPSLPHEYQFNLDIPEGTEALNRAVRFIENH
jgi:acetyl esterase/lipase